MSIITVKQIRLFGYDTTKEGDIANNMIGEYTIQLIDPLPNNIDETTYIFMIAPTSNNKNKDACNNILAYKHINDILGLEQNEKEQIKALYDSAVKSKQNINDTADSAIPLHNNNNNTLGGKRKNKTKQNKTKQNKTKQNKRKPRRRLQTRRYKKRV